MGYAASLCFDYIPLSCRLKTVFSNDWDYKLVLLPGHSGRSRSEAGNAFCFNSS